MTAPELIAPTVPRLSTADALRRVLDVILALVALVALAPILVALGVWVRLDSRGPALYLQQRVGLRGRVFWMLKFRTMRVDAETEGAVWPVVDDPRCTRAGRWLRRHSLDELPQLWNVLIGDMSLVGPRPERPAFVAEFRTRYAGYDGRHVVRGGITGWAQVNGLRGDTPIDRRLAYDLEYVRRRSLMFDARILFLTFREVANASRRHGLSEPDRRP